MTYGKWYEQIGLTSAETGIKSAVVELLEVEGTARLALCFIGFHKITTSFPVVLFKKSLVVDIAPSAFKFIG